MANLGKILKDEIRRLARSETKAATAALKNSLSSLRGTVRDLKAQNAALGKQVAALTKALPEDISEKAARQRKPRLSVRSIRGQRKRLGLTIAQFAELLGASTGSVVNWEQGKSKPSPKMRQRLIDIRDLGRREVKARLSGGA